MFLTMTSNGTISTFFYQRVRVGKFPNQMSFDAVLFKLREHEIGAFVVYRALAGYLPLFFCPLNAVASSL